MVVRVGLNTKRRCNKNIIVQYIIIQSSGIRFYLCDNNLTIAVGTR